MGIWVAIVIISIQIAFPGGGKVMGPPGIFGVNDHPTDYSHSDAFLVSIPIDLCIDIGPVNSFVGRLGKDSQNFPLDMVPNPVGKVPVAGT